MYLYHLINADVYLYLQATNYNSLNFFFQIRLIIEIENVFRLEPGAFVSVSP